MRLTSRLSSLAAAGPRFASTTTLSIADMRLPLAAVALRIGNVEEVRGEMP